MYRPFLIFLLLLLPAGAMAQTKAAPILTPSFQQLLQHPPADSVELTLQYRIGSAPLVPHRVLGQVPVVCIWLIRMASSDLDLLLRDGNLLFADVPGRPREELSTGFLDLGTNRINWVHRRFPGLRGDSLRVTVKEQAFDTSDIDLRGRVFVTGREAPTFTSHAAQMATILAGGGNSSPAALGAAPAALMGSVSFSQLLPEPDSFFRRLGISVQNHSYGTQVESFYGAEAAAYDALARALPELSLVFSSGNSGTTRPNTGAYANLPFSNLTGNFKMAKNVLVVGATDSAGMLEVPSSRGPAHDGRVKPELVAFGQDGSSGAAALVSGTVLLLQQAWRRQTGSLPSSDLVKAVLVNSAEEGGRPQVDYLYGYGRLNAADAVLTITGGRALRDSVASGQLRTHVLQVPAGIRRLRVSVAWIDPPAAAGASPALVNDLDLQLRQNASGNTWLPWVLQPIADTALLQQPAQRGRDSLNNVEQVTVDTPAAGTYTVEIRAARVNGGQAYAIAWQYDTLDRFLWTWPTAGDPIRAGEPLLLRWLSERRGTAVLEYQINGGAWQLVEAGVPLAQGYQRWQAPDTTGFVRFRLRSPGFADELSDSTVLNRPLQLQTGFNCADSFLLYWNRLPVGAYRLYALGGRYLEPLRQLADTFALLRKSADPWLYYAIAPLINGRPGVRSNTLKYDAQGVECYFRNLYVENQEGTRVTLAGSLGSTFRVAALSLQKLIDGRYQTLQRRSPGSDLLFTFMDSSLRPGINWYRLELQLDNGRLLYSEPVPVYFFGSSPVLVFPNPVERGRPLRIYANEPGRYEVQVVDAAGRTLHRTILNSLENRLLEYVLAPGVYFIRISSDAGRLRVEKVVVQ